MQIIISNIILVKLLSIISAPEIVSALIGAGVALLVFYFTIQNDKRKEKKKQEEIYNIKIEYLRSLIPKTREFAEGTIEELNSTINKIFENNIDLFPLNYVVNSSLDRMKEILKDEGYFSAYIHTFGKDKIKEYNNLSDIVEFFISQTKQVHIEDNNTFERDIARKEKFFNLTEEILSETSYILKTDLLSETDKQTINTSLVDFYAQHPESFTNKITYGYRFKYIRQLLEFFSANYSSVISLHPYFSKIKQASKLFKLIQTYNDEHAKYLAMIRATLKEAIEEYDLATKTLLKKSI